jgi:hypothetical protein
MTKHSTSNQHRVTMAPVFDSEQTHQSPRASQYSTEGIKIAPATCTEKRSTVGESYGKDGVQFDAPRNVFYPLYAPSDDQEPQLVSPPFEDPF